MSVSKREMFCYGLLAIFTALWAGAFSLLGMDLHHDGIMFKAAVDVAAGKWVFKEVFCQYGILSPLLQGGLLRIFGNELIVLKLGTAVFYAGIVVLNDLLWRRFLKVPFRVLNLVMFFVLAPYLMVPFHIWSSVYALFFMLLAAEFMLLGEEREKKLFFFLSGICTALVFGFRWPCGAVTLFAQLAASVISARCRKSAPQNSIKNTGVLLSGSGVVLALYALYLTIGNAWQDCFRQIFSFVGKFAWERGSSGSIVNLFETFFPHTQTIDFIFAFIPAAVIILFFYSCRKFFSAPQSMEKDIPLITLLLFGLAAYHQYYPVPCVRHLYWGAVPMMGAYALVIQRFCSSERLEKYKKVLYVFLLILPLLWGGFWRMYSGFYRISEFFTRQSVSLPGVRGIRQGRGEQYICQIASEIRSRTRSVFNYTADGIWSVVLPEASGFKHPMFVNWKQDVYKDYPDAALSYIDRYRPAVLSSVPFFHTAYLKAGEFEYMGVTYTLWIPRFGF